MSRISPCAAIVVAGGSGERFGRSGGKQLAPVSGKPVVSWTLAALARVPELDLIVLVCPPGRADEYQREAVAPLGLATPVEVVCGGATRRASVQAGIRSLAGRATSVVVHDGARPLVEPETVSATLAELAGSSCDGVIVGHPSTDTLKVVEEGKVVSTPDRASLWAVQTPQAFMMTVLDRAHESAERDGFEGTDDASLVERVGGTVAVMAGPRENIKITTREDVVFVEAILARRGIG